MTEKRLIIMGLTDGMRNNSDGEEAFYVDLQEFLQHELFTTISIKTEASPNAITSRLTAPPHSLCVAASVLHKRAGVLA